MTKEPHQISRKKISSLKFIELEEITWQGSDGKTRVWDVAERIGRLEAVMLVARLKPSDKLVLIRQYRPPVDDYVIEFPAGIIDKGESVETTALRELKEETGYTGKIIYKTPLTCNTPGLTSEAVYQLYLEIDETLPENINPQPTPDEGEHIEVVLVDHDRLIEFMNKEFENNSLLDSKVVAYIQGIKMPTNEYYFELAEIVNCERLGRSLTEKEKPQNNQRWAAIAECSLTGAAGLTAARHIANAGAEIIIYLESPCADSCSDFAAMLEVVGAMNLPIKMLGAKSDIGNKNYYKIINATASLPIEISSLSNLLNIKDISDESNCSANLPHKNGETELHKISNLPAKSCSAIREIDRQAMEDFGLPGICLMENAAIGATAVAADMLNKSAEENVLIAAGSGNNGGDGFAVSRQLTQLGFKVTTALLAAKEKLQGDALINFEIIEKAGLEIIDCCEDIKLLKNLSAGADLIIDGILGTGLSGEVKGNYKDAIEIINSSDTQVLALDIPSGLDGDSGLPLGTSINANKTVTFAAVKEGFLKEGADKYTGEIILADIGAPFELVKYTHCE